MTANKDPGLTEKDHTESPKPNTRVLILYVLRQCLTGLVLQPPFPDSNTQQTSEVLVLPVALESLKIVLRFRLAWLCAQFSNTQYSNAILATRKMKYKVYPDFMFQLYASALRAVTTQDRSQVGRAKASGVDYILQVFEYSCAHARPLPVHCMCEHTNNEHFVSMCSPLRRIFAAEHTAPVRRSPCFSRKSSATCGGAMTGIVMLVAAMHTRTGVSVFRFSKHFWLGNRK